MDVAREAIVGVGRVGVVIKEFDASCCFVFVENLSDAIERLLSNVEQSRSCRRVDEPRESLVDTLMMNADFDQGRPMMADRRAEIDVFDIEIERKSNKDIDRRPLQWVSEKAVTRTAISMLRVNSIGAYFSEKSLARF